MTRILIVDDERSIRTILSHLLARQGFDCAQAADAAEALALLEEEDFDVALCDVRMPGLSGVDLAGEITRRHPSTAVVMLTAEDSPTYASIAMDNGACGYMLKPFRANDLRITIAAAMRQCRERNRLETRLADRTGALQRALVRLQEVEMVRRAS